MMARPGSSTLSHPQQQGEEPDEVGETVATDDPWLSVGLRRSMRITAIRHTRAEGGYCSWCAEIWGVRTPWPCFAMRITQRLMELLQ